MTTRKASATTTNPAPIDLSGDITAGQVQEVITSLYAYTRDNLVRANAWCSSWTSYLRTVDPDMNDSGEFHDVPQAEINPEWLNDTGRAAIAAQVTEARRERLRNIRGRILHYADGGNITLDQANAALESAGLTGYRPETPAETRVYTYLPNLFLTVPAADADDRTEFHRKFAAAINASVTAIDGWTLDPDGDTPDESRIRRYIDGPYRTEGQRRQVPASEQVLPLSDRRR